MARVFIIVDVQKDFLPGGSLAIPNSDDIIQPIVEHAIFIHRNGGFVVTSRDYHPANHISFSENPEFKDYSWPPHCVQGTPGVKIPPKIKSVTDFLISKGDDPKLEAYSAFAGNTLRPKKSLEDILRENNADSVEIAGLAYDKCVGQTALDANALGWYTSVLKEMTRSISPEGERKMNERLERAGVHL